MEVYTIGFTKRSAQAFFESLKGAGIRRLLDIRRHNSSQLAGYAKQQDLQYFLTEICDAEYIHEPLLAPSSDLLAAYRGKTIAWPQFEIAFIRQIREERVEERVPRDLFAIPTVLLCSEPTPQRCHRRLVVEYLDSKWKDLTPVHL